jgi:hypothetical protein
MIAGLVSLCGKAVAATRGAAKIALGQNPNSPFQLMNLLHQFYSPGGGGGARSEGQMDNRAGSMVDNMNQVNRTAQMQSARAPAPPPPQR